jgi:2-polyprenyl-3-methyl-5-hydroxy-6-metoxy-1,4-benzoquinol methylase
VSAEKDYYETYWEADGQAPPDTDPLTDLRIKRFLEETRTARSVLDLGCGSGRGTRLLASSIRHVTGLDISHRPLLSAKKDCPAVGFLQAVCDGPLPFTSGSFDAVYCAEVIEHVFNPSAMVAECHRVLKPKGTLFITTPFHGLIKNLAIATIGFERHFDVEGPHIRFFTNKSLLSLLRRNSFVIQRVFYLGRCWPVWMDVAVCAVRT